MTNRLSAIIGALLLLVAGLGRAQFVPGTAPVFGSGGSGSGSSSGVDTNAVIALIQEYGGGGISSNAVVELTVDTWYTNGADAAIVEAQVELPNSAATMLFCIKDTNSAVTGYLPGSAAWNEFGNAVKYAFQTSTATEDNVQSLGGYVPPFAAFRYYKSGTTAAIYDNAPNGTRILYFGTNGASGGSGGSVSAAQVAAIMATNNAAGATNNVYYDYIVFEGDSLTKGNQNTTGWEYPTLLGGLYGLTNYTTLTNIAASGNYFSDITNQFATEIYPLRPAVTGAKHPLLLVWVGRNDLSAGVLTNAYIATWVSNLVGYATAAQNLGFEVAIFTITGSQFEDATVSARGAANAAIANNSYIRVFDVDSYFPNTSNTNLFKNSDNLHLSDYGNLLLARKIYAFLQDKNDHRRSPEIRQFMNRLGVNQPAPSASLDVSSNTWSVIIGDTVADATTKSGRLGMRHYTGSEEPVTLINANSSASGNLLYLGGGSSVGNTATEIQFYTAATGTTLTGTKAGGIGYAGRWTVGNSSGSSTADLSIYNATGPFFSLGKDATWANSKTAMSFGIVASGGSVALGSAANESLITARSGYDLAFATTASAADYQSIRMRLTAAGDLNVYSNLVVNGTITGNGASLTNLLFKTNYVAAEFAPTSGYIKFVGSNNALYAVSATKTNLISAP